MQENDSITTNQICSKSAASHSPANKYFPHAIPSSNFDDDLRQESIAQASHDPIENLQKATIVSMRQREKTNKTCAASRLK